MRRCKHAPQTPQTNDLEAADYVTLYQGHVTSAIWRTGLRPFTLGCEVTLPSGFTVFNNKAIEQAH